MEALSDDPDELVAGVVSKGVVDVLEPVQVHEEDGRSVAAVADPRQFSVQPLRQQGAIGKPGQYVVIGEVCCPGLPGHELRRDLLDVRKHEAGEEADCKKSDEKGRKNTLDNEDSGLVWGPGQSRTDCTRGVQDVYGRVLTHVASDELEIVETAADKARFQHIERKRPGSDQDIGAERAFRIPGRQSHGNRRRSGCRQL